MCTPWSSDWTIWWKWDRKPTKEQKLPESFLLVSSLTRNPENHFQTHPRIKAFLSMRSLKLHRLFHLFSSSLHRYYFLKLPNSCPWQQSFLTYTPHPRNPTISLSPFLSVWKTQEGETKGKCQSVTSVWTQPSMMCESGVWNGSFHGNEMARQAGESHALSTTIIETVRPSEGPWRSTRQAQSSSGTLRT